MGLHANDDEEIKPQWKARLHDSLSAATREKRRFLLLSSTVALSFVLLGLFPAKISALGIVFEEKDRAQMVYMLAAVIGYSFVGFCLYAWSDFHLALRSHAATTTGYIGTFSKGRSTKLETVNFVARGTFDYLFPLVYGGYANYRLYLLLKAGLHTIDPGH